MSLPLSVRYVPLHVDAAAVFTVAAHQQRLTVAECVARLRELSVIRLQRWIRRSIWRKRTLPRQLHRAHLLLLSCKCIQICWRSHRNSKGRRSTTPLQSVSSFMQHHQAEPVPCEEEKCTEEERQGTATRDDGGFDFPCGQRLLAAWRGHRIRRALASRSTQTKLQLRHDVYLLITDVEAKGYLRNAPTRHHAWVDTLYVSLSRLQHEVLQEFRSNIKGLQRGIRSSYRWHGWPNDLLRMPGLRLRPPSPAGSGEVSSSSIGPSTPSSPPAQPDNSEPYQKEEAASPSDAGDSCEVRDLLGPVSPEPSGPRKGLRRCNSRMDSLPHEKAALAFATLPCDLRGLSNMLWNTNMHMVKTGQRQEGGGAKDMCRTPSFGRQARESFTNASQSSAVESEEAEAETETALGSQDVSFFFPSAPRLC